MSYVQDFLKSLMQKSKHSLVVYLIINLYVISTIISFVTGIPYWQGVLWALVIYAISLTLTFSPVGEKLLCFFNGCREINRIDIKEKLQPIFEEVYSRAKKSNPQVPDDVKLYIKEDAAYNAFATGRKTLCVNTGLLQLSDNEIKSILGHEFGHLAHKDTDTILLVNIGNCIVNLFFILMRVIIELIHGFLQIFNLGTSESNGQTFLGSALLFIYRTFFVKVFELLQWIWIKIGVLLCMRTSRADEFAADRFSFNLGYGNYLCETLDKITEGTGQESSGLFANLVSNHPSTNDRIGRMQKMGASYRMSH
jgi:heat shock protein HtpX